MCVCVCVCVCARMFGLSSLMHRIFIQGIPNAMYSKINYPYSAN